MRCIEPFFLFSHGVLLADERRAISEISFVLKNGLRWQGAPVAYGPHKTICNRSIGWSRLGVGNGNIAIRHDPVLFRQPHKIEINSGRLKNRRRSHTRCHRSAHAFFSATRIAATVIVWPGQ
jgi:transposase